MIIETKTSDRAEARRYLKLSNIEFVETPDGFEIDPDHFPEVRKVLEDRSIVFYVNTGELL
jgi:hypothetical protein